jgi:lambda family phage portal protein
VKPRGLNARDAAARLKNVSTAAERAADAVLRFVAPRSALVRAHRRLMERDSDYRENWLGTDGLLAARGYKSAASPTNGTPWLGAGNRSADSELLSDLPTLRARNRVLERDDSLGSGVVRTRLRQVVGSGLRPQAATTGGRALNDVVEAVFAERSGELFPAEGRVSFAKAQQVIYTRLLVDGEILIARAKPTAQEPVWFELIEADRLGTPLDAAPADPDGRIVDGVEKDRYGRVVAYWVAKHHPGDVVRVNTTGRPHSPVALSKADYRRVTHDAIRHLRYRVTRPGQTRGVPLMHACMQDFHDLDLLTLALIKRTQVAACLSLFITSDQAIADLFEVTAEDYGYQLDQQLEPGMIFKLFPGEKIEDINPSFSVPDVGPMQKGIAQRIGAACEMSPEAITHDWGATNYSSARTVQIEDNRSYDTDRADLADQGLGWIWSETLLDAQLSGDVRLRAVDASEFRRVRWVGDARPWVDPVSQAQAVEVMLALGLTTLRDEAAALGKDWEELAEQRALERMFLAEFGEEQSTDDAEDTDQESRLQRAADRAARYIAMVKARGAA